MDKKERYIFADAPVIVNCPSKTFIVSPLSHPKAETVDEFAESKIIVTYRNMQKFRRVMYAVWVERVTLCEGDMPVKVERTLDLFGTVASAHEDDADIIERIFAAATDELKEKMAKSLEKTIECAFEDGKDPLDFLRAIFGDERVGENDDE